eukprot:scaffold6130_cov131-Cylindrotheca_fusiformis.AAC.1
MTWQGIVKSRVSRRPRLSFFPLGRAIVLATTIPYADALMNWSIFSGSFEQSKLLFSSLPEGSPTESILQNSLQEDKPIVRQTINWLQRSVIGLNLCPFAEKPFIQKRVSIEVIRGTDQVEILARVLTECLDRRKRPGTSLLICPELFPSNFLSFLEVYNMLQDGVLVDNGIDRDIQVAPFHPYFEFDGSGDNVDNYTNRSPFPIFHILREEEVSVAVDALQGDAEKVWKRNIQLLEALEDELGRDRTEQILKGTEQDAASRTAIERILEKVKKDGLPSQ